MKPWKLFVVWSATKQVHWREARSRRHCVMIEAAFSGSYTGSYRDFLREIEVQPAVSEPMCDGYDEHRAFARFEPNPLIFEVGTEVDVAMPREVIRRFGLSIPNTAFRAVVLNGDGVPWPWIRVGPEHGLMPITALMSRLTAVQP